MKRTKPAVPLLPGVMVFIIGLILFASLRWYGIWPTSSGRDYDYAIPIQVDYSIYGLTQGFELFRDITPYADPQLREKLTIRELTPKDQVYAYDIASDKELSKIYIVPPIIYTAQDIEPVSCRLKAGEVMYLSDGSPWFSISAIDGERVSLEIYDDTMLPRDFAVKAGEGEFIITETIMDFPSTGEFRVTEISFRMNTAYEAIGRVSDDITVSVTNVMKRYIPEEYKVISDGVEVIFCDGSPASDEKSNISIEPVPLRRRHEVRTSK